MIAEHITGSANCRNELQCDAMVPAVPQEAIDTYNYVRAHNGSPPPGYKGNRVYQNWNRLLPAGGDYREYDIDPNIRGLNRNQRRIVIEANTGQAWYTPDHYMATFVRFR